MKIDPISLIRRYPFDGMEQEVLWLAENNQIFIVWLPGEATFIVPDFQMNGFGTSLNVEALVMALGWTDRFSDLQDPYGLRRARWLYQPRRILSEVSLASCGHRPLMMRGAEMGYLEPCDIPSRHAWAITHHLSRQPRSFADIFADYPDVVIDFATREERAPW